MDVNDIKREKVEVGKTVLTMKVVKVKRGRGGILSAHQSERVWGNIC